MDITEVIQAYEKKQAILTNAKFILQNSGDIEGALDCELELERVDTALDQMRHLGPQPTPEAVGAMNVSDRVKQVCLQSATLAQKVSVEVIGKD